MSTIKFDAEQFDVGAFYASDTWTLPPGHYDIARTANGAKLSARVVMEVTDRYTWSDKGVTVISADGSERFVPWEK